MSILLKNSLQESLGLVLVIILIIFFFSINVYCIHPGEVKDKWQALLNTVINIWGHQMDTI